MSSKTFDQACALFYVSWWTFLGLYFIGKYPRPESHLPVFAYSLSPPSTNTEMKRALIIYALFLVAVWIMTYLIMVTFTSEWNARQWPVDLRKLFLFYVLALEPILSLMVFHVSFRFPPTKP